MNLKNSIWSFYLTSFLSTLVSQTMARRFTVHIRHTRNEHYASFSQAWFGIVKGRLGKFPSYSYPPPLLSSTEYLAWSQNPLLFSWTGLFLMCLWCRVWSVSLNGLYLFIPAARRLMRCFPRSLPGAFLSWNACMFNSDLNPDKSGPNMSSEWFQYQPWKCGL